MSCDDFGLVELKAAVGPWRQYGLCCVHSNLSRNRSLCKISLNIYLTRPGGSLFLRMLQNKVISTRDTNGDL